MNMVRWRNQAGAMLLVSMMTVTVPAMASKYSDLKDEVSGPADLNEYIPIPRAQQLDLAYLADWQAQIAKTKSQQERADFVKNANELKSEPASLFKYLYRAQKM